MSTIQTLLPGFLFHLHLYLIATRSHQHWPVILPIVPLSVLDLSFCVVNTYYSHFFSPGDVPDTHEALLNAFKRLDNDISLEAQVETLSCLKVKRRGVKTQSPRAKSDLGPQELEMNIICLLYSYMPFYRSTLPINYMSHNASHFVTGAMKTLAII